MPLVSAFDDIKPDQIVRLKKPPGLPAVTQFVYFKATSNTPDAPTALLARCEPGMQSSAHYHAVDQFQIIVEGGGKFGRHEVSPYCVHFSRAYTRYGPLHSDKKVGWAFMVLRTRYDPGSQRVVDELRQIPDRNPWQVTKNITFPAQGPGINLHPIAEIKDDQGLFAGTLTMAPHSQTSAPDPSRGDGQDIIVIKGSLIHGKGESKAHTVVFVTPGEAPFQIQAGAQGLEAIILNFPQVRPRTAAAKAPSSVAGYKKWRCELCSFTYDEAVGMPEEGIAAGTRWKDLPETWNCPDCSASKSDFQMVEV